VLAYVGRNHNLKDLQEVGGCQYPRQRNLKRVLYYLQHGSCLFCYFSPDMYLPQNNKNPRIAKPRFKLRDLAHECTLGRFGRSGSGNKCKEGSSTEVGAIVWALEPLALQLPSFHLVPLPCTFLYFPHSRFPPPLPGTTVGPQVCLLKGPIEVRLLVGEKAL